MKKAFITGIAGQDGSYLAEYLLEMGYEVHGIVRRNSTPEHQESRINHIEDYIKTYYGDLTDHSSIHKLLSDIVFTAQTNAVGVLNMLEAYRSVCPESKFYQASSSEMFGSSVDEDGFQRETTPMNPVSPYGCTKVFGYDIVRNYRKAYNLFASSGILFNHESPRRGTNFVTNKVVKSAVEIYLGQGKDLVLGNLDACRDWGHSKDYVRAMHLILQQPQAGDWVVATGETRSVRDMCEYVFSQLGLNYENHIIQNQKFLRPEELKYLKGDSNKIRTILGWKPEYTFETMMDEMIEYWLGYYKN